MYSTIVLSILIVATVVAMFVALGSWASIVIDKGTPATHDEALYASYAAMAAFALLHGVAWFLNR